MVQNLIEFGYKGYIHLVGPKGGALFGHKIHPTVMDIPDPVDLASVLVPARAVPEILRQCGEKGIRRVVVQSGGFREMGEDRLSLEDEVVQTLRRYDMRMIGPNGIGIMNRNNGLACRSPERRHRCHDDQFPDLGKYGVQQVCQYGE